MAENTIINYEQLQAIAKKMEAEAEAIAGILAALRQLVHDLEKEWIGTGSDAFFDEMETIVLPSMQRLCAALHFSAETTRAILKIYHGAEEDASAPFKGALDSVNLGSIDFGAGQFGNLGTGGSAVNLGATDFGAGQFGNLGAGPQAVNLGATDFGASQFEESSAAAGGSGESSSGSVGSGSSGGGGGSSSSAGGSGLQGGLDKMGVGLGGQAPQSSTVGGDSSGGGAQSMPDYIYGSGSAAGSSASSSQSVSGGGAATAVSPDLESGLSAAGAAGIAGSSGAAIAGAAKVVKGKLGKKDKGDDNIRK